MKRYLHLLALLLLVACVTNQSVNETPILTEPVVSATSSPTTATSTLLPATATHEPTVVASSTPTLFPTFTPEPTLTPTPIPPPTGRIYFLWDSQPLPVSGLGNPIQNMYLAKPVEDSTMWTIEIVLEGLVGWPDVLLSPDMTTIALTILEDRNKDGFVSQEGYNRGSDAPNLYRFDLITKLLSPITNDFPGIIEGKVYGLPDGQTFLLGQTYVISRVSETNEGTYQLGPTFSSPILWVSLSPNAEIATANLEAGQLSFLDIATGDTLLNFEGGGRNVVNKGWSSDGKWFAVNHPTADKFFLINSDIFAVETISLEGSIGLMAWSPIGTSLALHWHTSTDSRLLLFDPKSKAYHSIVKIPINTSLDYLGWSPDGTQLIYLLKQETVGSLYVVDLNGGEPQRIWQNETVGRFQFVCWSPEGEWILFFAGQGPIYTTHPASDIAIVYMVHKSGGTVYEFHETTGFLDPYGFFWLP